VFAVLNAVTLLSLFFLRDERRAAAARPGA
jgi:hypothetical protein